LPRAATTVGKQKRRDVAVAACSLLDAAVLPLQAASRRLTMPPMHVRQMRRRRLRSVHLNRA
jgi:hypothetical protein